jgi:hypothetical protein
MAFWPIKTKINTSSSTSPRGVPKQKNQHLQFRIEIMPKKKELYLSKMQIQRLCELPVYQEEHLWNIQSALFKKKSLVSILRKFLKPWGSSSDNYFTKAWWAPCFLHFWIQAHPFFSLTFFSLYSLKNTCIYYYAQRNNYFIFLVIQNRKIEGQRQSSIALHHTVYIFIILIQAMKLKEIN